LGGLRQETAGDRTVLLSTHIVEDIAQTCQRLAVLNQGRVLFRGTLSALVDAAQGKVWTLTTPADTRLAAELTVISTRRIAAGVRYRVVAERTPVMPGARIEPAQPTLEESYVWLMRDRGAPHASLSVSTAR
jgi:ABC-type multidrug transport system ATPase subunit